MGDGELALPLAAVVLLVGSPGDPTARGLASPGTHCSCPTAVWGRWLPQLLVLSRPVPVFITEPNQLERTAEFSSMSLMKTLPLS